MVDLSVLDNQYLAWGDLKDLFEQTNLMTGQMVGSVGGTADAITGSLDNPPASYTDGQIVYLMPTADNTGAVTINLDSLGAVDIKRNIRGTLTDLSAGNLRSGRWYQLAYDSTAGDFELLNPTITIISTNESAVGGTSNAITLTTTDPTPAYFDGYTVTLTPTSDVTGLAGATLAVDGLAAKPIEVYHPEAGFIDVQLYDMKSGVPYILVYNATQDAFILTNSSMPDVIEYTFGHNGSLITHSGSGWTKIGSDNNWYLPKHSMMVGMLQMSYSVNTGSNRLFDFQLRVNTVALFNSFMQNDAPVKQGTTGWETSGTHFARYYESTGGTQAVQAYWNLTDSSTKYTYRYNILAQVFPKYKDG